LPDKNTACSPTSILCRSLAIFNPARVFPAPGTPVTKQIDFCCAVFECSIISAIAADVLLRFIAPESDREISRTLCPLYNACAASMIVGVGLYTDDCQELKSMR